MKASNAKKVVEAGADCIAVVSAICSNSNPLKAAQLLKQEIDQGINNRATAHKI